ncbi:MAG: hypothetical protein SVS85_03340 [Candidatus Nanohaloarchaea archaeon]|nr:hypothetical protein [Candidatus Nanohaloarchaea archaeon]
MGRIERFNSFLSGYSGLSYPLIRTGLGLLWIVTGALQIIDPQPWFNFVSFFTSVLPVSPEAFLAFHGAVMIVEGLLLVSDFFTAVVSSIITLGTLSLVLNLLASGSTAPEMLYAVSAALMAAAVALEAAGRKTG